MNSFHHTLQLHGLLLYGAYGWLAIGGALHFAVDVVSQYFRGKRVPGPATTLYYGLNSTYAVSQVLFGALALFAIRHGVTAMGQAYGLALAFSRPAHGSFFACDSLSTRSHALSLPCMQAFLSGSRLPGFNFDRGQIRNSTEEMP